MLNAHDIHRLCDDKLKQFTHNSKSFSAKDRMAVDRAEQAIISTLVYRANRNPDIIPAHIPAGQEDMTLMLRDESSIREPANLLNEKTLLLEQALHAAYKHSNHPHGDKAAQNLARRYAAEFVCNMQAAVKRMEGAHVDANSAESGLHTAKLYKLPVEYASHTDDKHGKKLKDRAKPDATTRGR